MLMLQALFTLSLTQRVRFGCVAAVWCVIISRPAGSFCGLLSCITWLLEVQLFLEVVSLGPFSFVILKPAHKWKLFCSSIWPSSI